MAPCFKARSVIFPALNGIGLIQAGQRLDEIPLCPVSPSDPGLFLGELLVLALSQAQCADRPDRFGGFLVPGGVGASLNVVREQFEIK